jgi:hypothetical protein
MPPSFFSALPVYIAEIDVQFCNCLCVCARDVHYKCDIILRFDTFRLVRRVHVLIAPFCVVLRVRRDSPGRGERRLVLLDRTQAFAKLRSSSEVRNVQSSCESWKKRGQSSFNVQSLSSFRLLIRILVFLI